MNNSLFKIKLTLYLLLIIFLSINIFKILSLHLIIIKLIKVLSPLFIGYFLAWLLNPLYKYLNKKINKKLSLITIIIFYILILGFILLIIIPNIINSINNLNNINNKYIELIKKFFKLNTNNIMNSCKMILTYIGIFFISNIFGFYFLYRYDGINKRIFSLIKRRYRMLIHDISFNLRLYLKGLLIDSLVLFCITFIMFLVVGLDNALLFSLICSITNIIPFIGPYIGGAPSVLYALGKSTKLGIKVLIIIVITQMIESNLINPYIMSKCIKLSPILILTMVLVMGSFFGSVGMILAIPSLIVLKIMLETFYEKKQKHPE